jgi:hypothetical protein
VRGWGACACRSGAPPLVDAATVDELVALGADDELLVVLEAPELVEPIVEAVELPAPSPATD